MVAAVRLVSLELHRVSMRGLARSAGAQITQGANARGARCRMPCRRSSDERRARHARRALAAADRRLPRRDLAVPARHGDREHRAVRGQLRPAAGAQRRDGRAADAARRLPAVAAAARASRRACSARASRVRLVLLFALVAVLPGALVYAVSVQFLGKSIESWFDVRVDRALEGGLNLGRSSLDYLLKETGNKAAQMALSLSEGGGASLAVAAHRAPPSRPASTRRRCSRRPAACSRSRGIGGSTAPPEPPPAQALRRARLQQSYSAIEPSPDGGLRAARRHAGQHRRPARAAQAAAGGRAGAARRSRRTPRRCRPGGATTRRSRSRGRR